MMGASGRRGLTEMATLSTDLSVRAASRPAPAARRRRCT